MMIGSSDDCAFEEFGNADLGDPRRTRRLVKLASSLAREPGQSIASLSHLPCEMEGAYRLIRNDSVSSDAIAEAGFAKTVERAQAHALLLALEDTTHLVYAHSSLHSDLGSPE